MEIEDHGGEDFWGNPLYDGAPDIGAHEWQSPASRNNPDATGMTADAAHDPVAWLDGEPVSAAEFQRELRAQRWKAAHAFHQEHGAPGPGRWEGKRVNGETAPEMLRRLALEAVLHRQAERLLALEMGIIDSASFRGVMRRRDTENRLRSAKLEQGEPVYGPERFCEQTYADYFADRTAQAVKARLAETELALSEEELRRRYDRMASGAWPFEAVRGAIQMAHVDNAYPEVVRARLEEAEVRLNEDTLRNARVW